MVPSLFGGYWFFVFSSKNFLVTTVLQRLTKVISVIANGKHLCSMPGRHSVSTQSDTRLPAAELMALKIRTMSDVAALTQ